MKYIPAILLWLWAIPVFAASCQGEIEVNIVSSVASISDAGVVTGEQPQYCTTDASGTVCYY